MIGELLVGLLLLAVSVSLHLVGGLTLLLRLWRRAGAPSERPLVAALVVVTTLFGGLVVLHLVQVALWGAVYAWGIGWDLQTATYFSIVTYATIGYGDVVPPPDWRLIAAIEGLTGVLLLGCSSAMIFAAITRLFSARLRLPGTPGPAERERGGDAG